MPTIQVYIKERVYWILAREASRLDITIGKLIGRILEEYVNYILTKEGEYGKEKV